MDYEQKYKEALERARNLHKDAIDMEESLLAKQCEIIFPELKESERERDERIRKALLDYFGECEKLDINPVHDVQTNTILAWLEKQGEQDNWAEELNEKIKELHKQCLAKIQEYVNPCWEKMSEEDKRIRDELVEFVDINTLSINERHDRWISWLEKQGEQILANSAKTCKIENYQEEGWYSSGDDEYICGISFDEPIKLPVDFYYKKKEE